MKDSKSVTIIKPPSENNYWNDGILPYRLVYLSSVLSEHFSIKTEDLEIKIWDYNLDNKLSINLSLFSAKNVLWHCLKKEDKQILETVNRILELIDIDTSIIVFHVEYSSEFLGALALAKALKNKNRTIIFLGEYFRYIHNKIIKTYGFIDYIIYGTTVYSLNQFLRGIKKEDIPNLNWKLRKPNSIGLGGGNTINSAINLPDQYYSHPQLSHYRKYLKLYFGINKLVFSYRITNGCVNNCFFCGAPKNGRFRIKDTDQVVSDLIKMSKYYKSRFFMFADTSFIFSNKYAKELCRKIILNKLKFKFFGFCLYEYLDEDLIQLLKAAGCSGLSFGIESVSLKNAYALRKNRNLKKLPFILKLCKKNNIWTHLLFITGFPFQNTRDVLEDINFIRDNRENIDSILVQRFQLLMNSRIYIEPEKYGINSINYDVAPYVRDIPYDPKNAFGEGYLRLFKETLLKFNLVNHDPNYFSFLFNPALKKAIISDPHRFYSDGPETFLEKCKNYLDLHIAPA